MSLSHSVFNIIREIFSSIGLCVVCISWVLVIPRATLDPQLRSKARAGPSGTFHIRVRKWSVGYVGSDGKGGGGGGGCWLSENQGRLLGGEEDLHRTAD